jgi:hypothetical protein
LIKILSAQLSASAYTKLSTMPAYAPVVVEWIFIVS